VVRLTFHFVKQITRRIVSNGTRVAHSLSTRDGQGLFNLEGTNQTFGAIS
jgi:hypothetical protein